MIQFEQKVILEMEAFVVRTGCVPKVMVINERTRYRFLEHLHKVNTGQYPSFDNIKDFRYRGVKVRASDELIHHEIEM